MGLILAGPPLTGRSLATDLCFWITFLNSSSPAFDNPLLTASTRHSSKTFWPHPVGCLQSLHTFRRCLIHHFLYFHYYKKTDSWNRAAIFPSLSPVFSLTSAASLLATSMSSPYLSRAAVALSRLSQSSDSKTLRPTDWYRYWLLPDFRFYIFQNEDCFVPYLQVYIQGKFLEHVQHSSPVTPRTTRSSSKLAVFAAGVLVRTSFSRLSEMKFASAPWSAIMSNSTAPFAKGRFTQCWWRSWVDVCHSSYRAFSPIVVFNMTAFGLSLLFQ